MTHISNILHFQHPYRSLGSGFFADVTATPLAAPHWVHFNDTLASELAMPAFALNHESAEFFCGNQLFDGQKPLAMLYSGHQFGQNVPQLGDGRAMQLGSTLDVHSVLREWQLKGAGKTPFSRQGDGRAVLRSSIREYLCSEAMAGLGIPSTRALALIGSPTPVFRESRETAATVMRIAPSFVRFGSFEVFYYRGQIDEITSLADWVIEHHYPACVETASPYVSFLDTVIDSTAKLIADWQAVGFCHGVMNTDNMSVLGLTLDYGPFGFLDTYDPAHICNHSDFAGRYSYENQPFIGFWNLHCLAQAILPLIDDVDAVKASLERYWPVFDAHLLKRMSSKLGLIEPHGGDDIFIKDTLALMSQNQLDFTRFFRRLASFETDLGADIRDDCLDLAGFDTWANAYLNRLQLEPNPQRAISMNAVNPKYVLRNHLAQQAIELAQNHDFSEVAALFTCLQNPFAEQTEFERFNSEPDANSQIEVSCSS